MTDTKQSESTGLWAGTSCAITKQDKITFSVLLAVGVFLRFLFLGRADLWQDEMLFVNLSNIEMTPGQVWSAYWNRWLVGMAWLPLPGALLSVYMRFMQAWVPDVMHNPFWVRLPGAVIGSIAVPVSLLAYRYVVDRRKALMAALLMCCTVFPIFYSRELHAYPLVLFLSTCTFWLFLAVCSGRGGKIAYAGFVIAVLAQLYTHLTCAMLYAGLCVTLFCYWWWMRFRKKDIDEANRLFRFGILCAVIAGASIPILQKVLGGQNPHLANESELGVGFILNDAVSKLFLGDHIWTSLLAWIVLGMGVWSLSRSGTAGRVVVGIVLLSLLLICLAAKRTQYLSVRYFTAVAPPILLVLAAGLAEIGRRLDLLLHVPRRVSTGWVLLSALVAVHLFVFLPPIYSLRAKSVDFGRIARWLNENLESGTPYLMNSAYELRLIPGYFDTPGLVAVSPYVHGGSKEELVRLFRYQRQFLEAFPESPYIESDSGQVLWSWPAEHFAQHIRLTNDALRLVVKRGIYPTLFRKDLYDGSLITTIYRNTFDDRIIQAKKSGEALVLRYPRSTCIPIGQAEGGRATLYARLWQGANAELDANVIEGRRVEGTLRFAGALAAPAGDYRVVFYVGTNAVSTQHMVPGEFRPWVIPLSLEESAELILRVEDAKVDYVQGIVMADLQYEPEESGDGGTSR